MKVIVLEARYNDGYFQEEATAVVFHVSFAAKMKFRTQRCKMMYWHLPICSLASCESIAMKYQSIRCRKTKLDQEFIVSKIYHTVLELYVVYRCTEIHLNRESYFCFEGVNVILLLCLCLNSNWYLVNSDELSFWVDNCCLFLSHLFISFKNH